MLAKRLLFMFIYLRFPWGLLDLRASVISKTFIEMDDELHIVFIQKRKRPGKKCSVYFSLFQQLKMKI